jgi:hypothetical protein
MHGEKSSVSYCHCATSRPKLESSYGVQSPEPTNSNLDDTGHSVARRREAQGRKPERSESGNLATHPLAEAKHEQLLHRQTLSVQNIVLHIGKLAFILA